MSQKLYSRVNDSLLGLYAVLCPLRLVVACFEFFYFGDANLSLICAYFACSCYGICMFLLRRSHILSESLAALVTTELSIIILFLFGHCFEVSQSYIYSITSMCYFFFIQIPQLNDYSKYRYAVCIKQAIYVIGFGCYSGKLSFSCLSDIFFASLSIFCLFISIVHQLDIDRMLNCFTELVEAKSQLNAIITAVPVGLIVINRKMRVAMHNDAAERLLDCPEIDMDEELLSLTYLQGNRIYNCIDTKRFRADLQHYLEFGTSEATNFGLVTYEGKTLSLIGNKTTWKGDTAAVIVMKDVTSILQLEQTRSEFMYKNMILRSVSHELRTPANGILHNVIIVEEAGEISSWANEKLKVAEVCSRQLLILIDDMLDYSQLILGHFNLVKSVFNLRKIIMSSFEMLSYVAQQKRIQMVISIDPLLPEEVYTDSKRFSQVLVNLLNNAIKYTLSGGRIELKASLNDFGFMEVTVKDNGIGIPAEHLKSAFKVLGKPIEGSSMNPQGCGLGLHISNILVGLLGNQNIKAESELGKGSSFTFMVDIFQDTRLRTKPDLDVSDFNIEFEDELKEAVYIPLFCCHTKDLPNILIVDDTPFNRMVVKDFLMSEGLNSLEVESGNDCIDLVMSRAKTENPIKVIIMDFEMPEMDGPTATRLLIKKLQKLGCELPSIVAHTAYVSHEDQVLCLKSGMIDFIPKPTSRVNFLTTIKQYL